MLPLQAVAHPMLRVATTCLLLGATLVAAWPCAAQARSASAHIQRVTTPVAILDDVRVQLTWPRGASQGRLQLHVARLHAPDLGYRFSDVDWSCALQRDPDGGWRCEGPVQVASGATASLSVALQADRVDAVLGDGGARVSVHHAEATPDLTRIDLTRVPLAWTQAMLAQAWPAGELSGGTVDSRLVIDAGGERLHISGPLRLSKAALDTPDGTIAALDVGARLALDARLGDLDQVVIDGQLRGGELLFGNAYIALQQRAVGLRVEATHREGQAWRLPYFTWRDHGILAAEGSAAFDPQADLAALQLQLHSPDLAPLRDAYLLGWLGLVGLDELALAGSADARVRIAGGELRAASLSLHDVDIDHPDGRFGFDHLAGEVRYSASAPVTSALHWRSGELYGIAFGKARLPFASADGVLRLREPVTLPLLGGQARFDHVQIKPPAGEHGLEVRFGLALEQIDVGRLTRALGWPAFSGQLSGRIARARYANKRLDFDGGLQVQVFGGQVMVSSLAMERPFGVAPTLSADVRLDDLSLRSLTSAVDFGTITGKLDGHILDLRLVNWQPVAFDAWLHTDRHPGVAQRISRSAVQDLASAGSAPFASSLQARLIALFNDFGYDRIGIGCKLRRQVCMMRGLGSPGAGFAIVDGSGLPHLSVIGFNRRVDWPTLVERLAAVGSGDVAPVVE